MRTFLSAVCLASVVTLVCYTDWSLFEGGGRFNGWMRKCVRAVCPLKPPKQATCTLLKIEWNWWVTPQWRKWNVFECQIFHGVLIGLNDCSNFSMDSINYDFSNHRHQGWHIACTSWKKDGLVTTVVILFFFQASAKQFHVYVVLLLTDVKISESWCQFVIKAKSHSLLSACLTSYPLGNPPHDGFTATLL